MSIDHGALNVPLSKRGNLDREIDAWKREQLAAAREDRRAAAARRATARAAEQARPKLTAADLDGARYVRDAFGWHEVVRVNGKSVTVATPYSWTDRIPFDKILEVLT